jgi:hypothetical protein
MCEAGKYKAAAPPPPPTPPVVVVYDFTSRNSIGDYQSYCSQIGATCVLTNYWVGGVSHSDTTLPNVRTSISLSLLATHNRLVVDYYAIANRNDVSISIDDVVMQTALKGQVKQFVFDYSGNYALQISADPGGLIGEDLKITFKYLPESEGVNTACNKCEAGKFKASAGVNTICDNCPAGTFSAAVGATISKCPDGWTYLESTCFRFYSTALAWATARQRCVDLGGDLAYPANQAQHDLLWRMAGVAAWIGVDDSTSEGSWRTPGGQAISYSKWCTGEPNGVDNENCGHLGLQSSGCWNDSPCTGFNRPYICQKQSEPVCTPCQAGKFSAAAASTVCTNCEAGKSCTTQTQPTTSATTTPASMITIRITLSLPMSPSAFTHEKQTAFKASLAQAAGVASEAVVINKIEGISSRRHLLAESIRVDTSIMAPGQAAAQEMAGRLTADSINRELSKAGLPTATVLEAANPALNPSTSTTSPELSASNTGTGAVVGATAASSSALFPTPVLVGGILGIVFLAGIVACFCHWKCKNHSIAPSHDTQTPATVEMGTRTTSVDETLVSNDLEVSSVPRSTKIRGAGELCYRLPEREAEATVPHIPYSELAVESTALAAGSFKSVYKARWEKKGRNVALLVLRNSNQAALSDMENEIRMFGTLGKHKHLAELLATCTQAQSEDKCMVMEFAPLGSLDHVLSKADEDGVDIGNLVKMTVGMQVAEAMTHLHLHNVLHRDLAIRNTLAFRFDPQNWKMVLVKVTDYGLSLLIHKGFTSGISVVEIQTISSNATGPTRWMAPESIMRRVYSKKSDVWSFGVLLYEVWTLGMIPYHLIAHDKEVARLVTEGERLSRPNNCPKQMYAIMQNCWKSAQKDRPSMTELQTALQEVFMEESLETTKSECVVCLTAEPVMALMPCGHRCACVDCAPLLRTCPICRCPVQEAKRIFG